MAHTPSLQHILLIIAHVSSALMFRDAGRDVRLWYSVLVDMDRVPPPYPTGCARVHPSVLPAQGHQRIRGKVIKVTSIEVIFGIYITD